jgi:hypothetical protein
MPGGVGVGAQRIADFGLRISDCAFRIVKGKMQFRNPNSKIGN